jgi:hypothetical protein
MVPFATPSRRVGLALLVIAAAFVGLAQPSVNDLPGFSDHTGPTEASVTSLERIETGCADEVATRGSTSLTGGNYEKVTFVETARTDADLSARVERTSPAGTDLSTFRVHVESHADGPANESCETGVLYRIEIETSGGSPEGFLPDAYGTRILWLQNGAVDGCSSSVTSPLDAECNRFMTDSVDRTWANATA